MLIRRVETTEATAITMPDTSGVSMRLMVSRADGAPNFSMRHFTVAPGGHTPRHSHNYEHEVMIVAGSATVESDDSLHQVRQGDFLMIAPNTLHQFRNTGQCDLQFVCLVPSTFDCGQPTPGS